jgi:hypothetical protein
MAPLRALFAGRPMSTDNHQRRQHSERRRSSTDGHDTCRHVCRDSEIDATDATADCHKTSNATANNCRPKRKRRQFSPRDTSSQTPRRATQCDRTTSAFCREKHVGRTPNGVGSLLPLVTFHSKQSTQWQKAPDTFPRTTPCRADIHRPQPLAGLAANQPFRPSRRQSPTRTHILTAIFSSNDQAATPVVRPPREGRSS